MLREHERAVLTRDLTVEAHVIREEFQSLFTPEEIATAKRRLDEYGYDFRTSHA